MIFWKLHKIKQQLYSNLPPSNKLYKKERQDRQNTVRELITEVFQWISSRGHASIFWKENLPNVMDDGIGGGKVKLRIIWQKRKKIRKKKEPMTERKKERKKERKMDLRMIRLKLKKAKKKKTRGRKKK